MQGGKIFMEIFIMDINFNELKQKISRESKEYYSNPNNIKKKWLRYYGELSVNNDTYKNQKCIREVFNLVHVIFQIHIENFMNENKPSSVRKQKKGGWSEKIYIFNGSEVSIKKGYEKEFFACCNIIRQIGYDMHDIKIDEVRMLRNLSEHNGLTVYEGNIDLSYQATKEAMCVLAEVLVCMGMLEEKYKEPSVEDMLIKKTDIVWDGYEIKELIGEGGSSRVYETTHPRLRKKLAIKEIKPGDYCEELIKNECDNLVNLNHSQIPNIYDTFSRHNIYYIVMDYIEGSTLAAFGVQGNANINEKLKIIISLCEIFEYLHGRANMIYVDLKPENIIIDKNNIPYLVDFGISTNKSSLEMEAMTWGYTAPEIYKGEVDKKSDIYSLGRVLEYLVHNEEVSSQLDCIIKKCIEEKKENRFNNISEVKEALLELINGNNIKIKENNSDKQNVKNKKNGLIISIVLILSIGLLALLIVFGDKAAQSKKSGFSAFEEKYEEIYVADATWEVESKELWYSVNVYNYTGIDMPYDKLDLKIKIELSDGTEKEVTIVYNIPQIEGEKIPLTKRISFNDLKIQNGISVKKITLMDYEFE